MFDAEQCLAATVFAHPETLSDLAGMLSPEDFFSERYGTVYRHALKLASEGRGVDFVTVERSMLVQGENTEVLKDCWIDYGTTDVMVMEYAKAIREHAVRRRMKQAFQGCLEAVQDPQRPVDELVAMAEAAALLGASQGTKGDLRAPREYLQDVFRVIALQAKGEITGLRTGFTDLDKHTAGLQRGDEIVLAGRPGMGKTALAMDCAAYAAIEDKKTVAFFEVEMSGRALHHRLLLSRARINGQVLSRGQLPQRDFPRLSLAVPAIEGSKLFVDETTDITPLQILAKCRRLKAKHGLDLVVVDCLQKLKGDGKYGGNIRVEISDISKRLKNMAKDLDVPLIAISHLSREVERRPDKVPELSDLHEAGNIEQDADIVMLLYRKDEYFDVEPSEKGKTDVIFAKFRNGETGIKHLAFQKEYATFKDWSDREEPPERKSDGWYGTD